MIIFGYGVAHKVTGKRLALGRGAYDTKNAASAALNKSRKSYDWHIENGYQYYGDLNPHECIVVPLVNGTLQ
ncbi:hypothetical protein vBPpSSYP_78 [Pseudomonas phage vB_PpS_SYP]|nr:hypothetical protein vBPpSSYP_78 [Pseudomonas phage vB_PpS_SYP]